jgi:hypothetical protein
MKINIELGTKIRDLEDGDCYFEGVVVELNPLKYKITNILWGGKIDTSMNGQVIRLKWWLVEVYRNNEWVEIKAVKDESL